jgi:FkbM family methyltransferase
MVSDIEHWLKAPVESAIDSLTDLHVAVDVGANSGSWTLPLSKLFDRVVAIEPDDRVSPVPDGGIENVELLRVAVSDEDGKAQFYLRPGTGQNSLLEVHPIGGESMSDAPVVKAVEVDCVTLDSVLPNGADFVKLDIEGAEAAALRGCADESLWERTVFVVECHDTLVDVTEELVRLGKTVTVIPHPYHSHPGHCWAIGRP